MYVLISRIVMKTYRINTKTIRREAILLNDLSSLMQIPLGSLVLVFYDNSIELSYLLDIEAALDLKITVVVNNTEDEVLCRPLFTTKLVNYDLLDGALVKSIGLGDDKTVESLSRYQGAKPSDLATPVLIEEARRLALSSSNSETVRLVASAYINQISVEKVAARETQNNAELVKELTKKNIWLKASLDKMSKDVDDFIKTYSQLQTQISARNVLDVIKDNSSIVLPESITSLVIKNYGIPHLVRFVLALKDSLVTSYDKHTKVIYVCEPDAVSLNEINRSGFTYLDGSVQVSDLLKNDLFYCVGNVRAAVDSLLGSSAMDVLLLVDSRRVLTSLVSGQTLTMYTAMDLDIATNLGLDPKYTITASERSTYTLREQDFIGKKRHALRNNKLVSTIINTLLEGDV